LDLVADQLGTALANARARAGRERADALARLDPGEDDVFQQRQPRIRTHDPAHGPLEDGLTDPTTPLAPVHRERQELAHRNALRLLWLVNTLLDFSRIEAERIDAAYERTDLATFTKAELASVFRSAVEKAGLALVVDCDPLPDVPSIETCGRRSSSICCRTPSSSRSRVRLRWSCGGRRSRPARVADTGVGIPASDLPHISNASIASSTVEADPRRHRHRIGARAGVGPLPWRRRDGDESGRARHDLHRHGSHRDIALPH
jgi:signal transduction histidine kinase